MNVASTFEGLRVALEIFVWIYDTFDNYFELGNDFTNLQKNLRIVVGNGLEDQQDQHMEWKPASQPEHASLKQCQLIVANRCSGHPQQVVEIRFLCNVIDAGTNVHVEIS